MIIKRCHSCPTILKDHSSFEDLSLVLKEDLANLCRLIVLTSDTKQPSEAQLENKVYFLAKGRLFLSSIDQNGKKVILGLIEEGEIFGNLDFLNSTFSDNSLFIEPLPKTEAQVCEFPKEHFLNILLKHPNLIVQVLSFLSKKEVSLNNKVQSLIFSDLKSRLLTELIRLGSSDGKYSDCIKIQYKITHEKLAEATGSVRETISKAFIELRGEGILSYGDKRSLMVDLSSQAAKNYLSTYS